MRKTERDRNANLRNVRERDREMIRKGKNRKGNRQKWKY